HEGARIRQRARRRGFLGNLLPARCEGAIRLGKFLERPDSPRQLRSAAGRQIAATKLVDEALEAEVGGEVGHLVAQVVWRDPEAGRERAEPEVRQPLAKLVAQLALSLRNRVAHQVP